VRVTYFISFFLLPSWEDTGSISGLFADIYDTYDTGSISGLFADIDDTYDTGSISGLFADIYDGVRVGQKKRNVS
jgi:hypothetical protein